MSMKPNSNKSISRRLLSVLFFSLVVSITHSLFAACVPQSATLYADADDELYLWINGSKDTTHRPRPLECGGLGNASREKGMGYGYNQRKE